MLQLKNAESMAESKMKLSFDFVKICKKSKFLPFSVLILRFLKDSRNDAHIQAISFL